MFDSYKIPKWIPLQNILKDAIDNNEHYLNVRLDTRDLKAYAYDESPPIQFLDNSNASIHDVCNWLGNVYIRGSNIPDCWMWTRNSIYKYVGLSFNLKTGYVTIYNRNNELGNIHELSKQ